jgi:hypothetical protein
MQTKSHFEKLENATKILEGLGLENTSAFLDALKGLNLSPPEEMYYARRRAIEDVVKSGQAGATWGKLYPEAVKRVDAEMKSDPAFQFGPGTSAQGMALYEKERRNRLVSTIYNMITNDPNPDAGWKAMSKGVFPGLMPYLVGGATQAPPVQ